MEKPNSDVLQNPFLPLPSHINQYGTLLNTPSKLHGPEETWTVEEDLRLVLIRKWKEQKEREREEKGEKDPNEA